MRSLFENDKPPARDSRRVWMWWAEGLLLGIGTVLLAWFGWNWAATAVDQSWSEYAFDASLQGAEPTVGGYIQHVLKGDAPAPPSAAAGEQQAPPAEGAACPRPRAVLPRGQTVGRIEVPRLNIEAIVRSGVDDKTLGRAVGHVPHTALPGEPGNVGLAAHRDTFFRNLRGVKVGDLIRVTTSEGTYEYKVDSLKIVLPKNVEVLDPTPEPALTLVTCYPFNYVGHAPKRFIVRARQVGVEATQRPAGGDLASPSKASHTRMPKPAAAANRT